jgi:acyl-CoA synthetase
VTLSDLVARHARERPDAPAYVSPDERMTWREYHARATGLAGALHDLGLERGSRVGVLLPDGPGVHVAFVAVERAGLVIVGIGPRAGDREIEHLLTRTGARAWIADGEHAALAARLEQANARLREAAIERDARAHLTAETVKELEALGIIGGIDERTARSEIRRLASALEAVEQLQMWVESRLELSAA